jgi:hypothetical protein
MLLEFLWAVGLQHLEVFVGLGLPEPLGLWWLVGFEQVDRLGLVKLGGCHVDQVIVTQHKAVRLGGPEAKYVVAVVHFTEGWLESFTSKPLEYLSGTDSTPISQVITGTFLIQCPVSYLLGYLCDCLSDFHYLSPCVLIIYTKPESLSTLLLEFHGFQKVFVFHIEAVFLAKFGLDNLNHLEESQVWIGQPI